MANIRKHHKKAVEHHEHADRWWILYASFKGWSPDVGGKEAIWRVPINGGVAVQMTNEVMRKGRRKESSIHCDS
jgi:hypothetical protein